MRPRSARRRRAGVDPQQQLLADCHRRAVALLEENLTAAGMLAASVTARAERLRYTTIFGRDAAICSLGMAVSGDRSLTRGAAAGLRTLAAYQAPSGQIPNFVDARRGEADFWYLGCIDATLWWLIAIAFLDDRGVPRGLKRAHRAAIGRALGWLCAQEHQRLFLLQQNEASDWADIMPRSGFVLYTNALWYHVKRLYGLARAPETRRNFNALFHPFSGPPARDRRARLLANFAHRTARRRELYLSFVNFSFFGEEGDVLGNLLAVLLGLAGVAARNRTLRALRAAHIHRPAPVRVVVQPIRRTDPLWRRYMARHRQNLPWQYHNGGIWPFAGGLWVIALAALGHPRAARRELVRLAQVCSLGNWRFSEWLHGRTLALRGMRGQSWNAAAFLLAEHALASRRNPFAGARPMRR